MPAAAAAAEILARFHPAVANWFTQTLGRPTQAQAQGWEAILARRHTLIAAPTGSGKTLAAFLAAIDGLVREGLPPAVREGGKTRFLAALSRQEQWQAHNALPRLNAPVSLAAFRRGKES